MPITLQIDEATAAHLAALIALGIEVVNTTSDEELLATRPIGTAVFVMLHNRNNIGRFFSDGPPTKAVQEQYNTNIKKLRELALDLSKQGSPTLEAMEAQHGG